MATGYTYHVINDPSYTFEQFVWLCARAMGACVMMRDEPMDALPPLRFEPSTYYLDALNGATAELNACQDWNEEQWQAHRVKNTHRSQSSNADYRERCARNDARLDQMIERVLEWDAPDNHQGLKLFMLDQLRDSKHGPVREVRYQAQLPLAEFKEQTIKRIKESIVRYRDEWANEQRRTEERNKWLADLRESVPMPATLKSKKGKP